MKTTCTLPLAVLALLLATLAPLFAGGLSDSFGYSALTTGDAEAIPYQFTDISATTPALSLTLAGGDNDDGGALITLDAPFPFYDSFYDQVVMSTNGYLSFNLADTGGDFSNDSDLSTPPSTGAGPRIYPLHDDLVADSSASLHYQYFPEGLRTYPLLPKIGVHIFQWNNIRFFNSPGNTDRFSFQALLFDDGTIHFVYPPGNPQLGSSSTTGILNADASISLLIATNTPDSIPGTSTATLYPPKVIVTSNADSGTGSLRQALADAPNPARIFFDPTVFNSEANRTIDLTSGELSISATALTIDAQSVCGITLNAGGASRVLGTAITSTTILDALNITGGRAIDGGGISNNGRLTIVNCTLYQNEAENAGGGLRNNGSARLENTTLYDNGAGRVGTLPEPNFGGGINNNGSSTRLTLISCTISANEASEVDGGVSFNGTQAIVQDTVIAGNFAPTNPDVFSWINNPTSRGGNFIGSNEGFTSAFPAGNPNPNGDYVGDNTSPLDPGFLTSGDAFGSTGYLTNHGGPTLTLMPLPGSPLIDIANPTLTPCPDQRGVATLARRDIGAVETRWTTSPVIPDSALVDITSPSDSISIYPSGTPESLGGVAALIDNDPSDEGATTREINTGFTITPASGATRLLALSVTASDFIDALSNAPASYLLLGSHDLNHFLPLASGPIPAFTAELQKQTFALPAFLPAFPHYRVLFPSNHGGSFLIIGEIELLGVPAGLLDKPVITSIATTLGGAFDIHTLVFDSRPDRAYQLESSAPGLESFNPVTANIVISNPADFSTQYDFALPTQPTAFFRIREKQTWQTTTVDSDNNVGIFTSLAFSPAGLPAIAYQDFSNSDVKFAAFDGASWQTATIDETGFVGIYAYFAFSPAGLPAISYYDSSNLDLKFAAFDGASWQTTTVDSDGDVGTHTSLAFSPAGLPAIAYFNFSNGVLKFAAFNGASWQITTVDDTGFAGTHTSLAFSPDGLPAIAYYDINQRRP
jgi:hypothetical protein